MSYRHEALTLADAWNSKIDLGGDVGIIASSPSTGQILKDVIASREPGKTRYPRETTPLLRKAISCSTSPHTGQLLIPALVDEVPITVDFLEPPSSFPRHLSTDSMKSAGCNYHGGQSTFSQTLFNTTSLLLGIGTLSEPLAFAYSGWSQNPRSHYVFGPSSAFLRRYRTNGIWTIINALLNVAFVTLYADSLHTLIPSYSTTTYKLWGLLFILSFILVIFVVLIDGFCKSETPGSLWTPAETNFGVQSSQNLGLAFGLFMAGLSGHAVIPTLARDMKDPSQFDRMVNWAFFIGTTFSIVIGYAGYRMFGNNVSEEISMDLMRTPGYSLILNKIALWMLVISPLSKFALIIRPISAAIESLFGINNVPPLAPANMDTESNGFTTAPQGSDVILKRVFAATQRVIMTVLSVTVSILVPNFAAMMALLGSFTCFALCLIGPLSAKIALTGRCNIKDGVLFAVSMVMTVWGMVAAASAAT
ncbi:hypothetical protein C0995_014814 [Termitomyces sp. Mi166|nr:hypothetical protein C0995_014814 [Termitomyces sp. Mi166\